jgi:hypothetical protein
MRIVVMILFLIMQINLEASVKNSNSASISWSLIFGGLILFGLLIAVIILLKHKAELVARIGRRDKTIIDLKETIKVQKHELDTKNRALLDTKSIIDESELVIEELRMDLEINEKKSEPMVDAKPINSVEENSEKDKPAEEKSDVSANSFYAKCLVENEIGFLIPSKASNHQTPYIIEERKGKYIFTVNQSDSHALKNALNFFEVYVSHFCEIENAYLNTHNSFHAVDNGYGLLEKEGSKYRVLEKIKIKFV